MDIVATQVYEDYDSTPTQKVSYSIQQDNVQIGELCIDSTTFPIKKGINQIGRHPNCCIVLDNPTVSKKHAEIEANSYETASWICDLNSSNKTKLNNSILRPNRCYELKTGDVLEFGLVRAVFKVSPPLNDSLIPDTPALNHQKTQQRVIPGTPDSSLNNSSANVSLIPATQDERKKSVFRYPTLPLRTSTTGIRKSVQNSSIDDQDNSQSFGVEKQNVGESRISIYDMETQNFSCSSYNETNIDIHDAESQKICILNSIKNLTKSVQEQNVDMGKQSKIGAPEEVTDIHDIETQHDIDFHDIETAKKINIHNFKTQDNSIGDSEKLEKTGIEEEKNSTMEGRSNVNNTIIQEKKDNDSTSHCNITKDKNKSEKLSDIENDLQKRVEVVETSEDDASDFDMSRNLLSPQDLEEFEDDNLSDEIKSRSPTSIKASCVNDDSGVNSKSIDNENIYEAATQVNKIDKNDFRASLVDDSDDTDNEVVFQRYSRNDSQESKKSSKNQVSDSDDSITDEEGHFTEIAAKVKKAIETSLEIRHNRSKEMKNGNSSRDSEDLFNMLTQPSNLKNEDLSSKCNKKLKDNENENEVDSDSPTQVIDKKSTNMEISKEIGIEEIDDMASTQILPMNKSSFRETSSIISTRNNKDSSEEDITEMEYNRPTQIINTEEKALDTSNNNRLTSSNSSVLITIEEYNTENIDYEMACTQPIGDIEKQTSVSSSVTDKNENKSKSTTMNFDDSVERKLKVMFKNTIEEHIENQPQISIQALENILELSQKDESPNVNSNSTASRKATKSKKGRKSETAIVKTSPSSASHKKSCNSPLSLRQHNTANLESVRNIINEESEKETEDLLISNSVPTDLSTPKSTIKNPSTPKSVCKYPSTSKSPKDPSTPKSLRQKHFKESKIANTVKNDNDKLKNCEENVGDQELGTSNGEQLQQISKILISEDEDILAGLPEVRISGTLSNPPSPTLSEYRININKNRTKQISIKIAPKKRGISRKSSRRTLDHRIIENATHIINEQNSMATSESSSNSFVNNLNADKISVCENDEKKVEKEVLVEKVVAAEPAIKNVVRKSRFRKRSLSMTDVDNSSPKKRKDINGDVSVKDSNKKIINGRQSENILDFIVRKNLSNNGKMSEEANLNKEAIVKVERISLSTPTGSISNTSTESEIENDNRNRNRQNRYKNVVNSQIASSTLTKEIKKTTQNVEMRRNTSRRITKKNKSSADDISSEVGEESQEVEMIMNGALKEQNTNSNTETKKNARNTRMRSTRKRGNTNVYIDTDNTETSSVSSVLSEPDNAYLEVPISRNKRAKVTKNSLIVTNTTVNEYIKETRGGNKRSTRSTRGQQSIMDSSVESIANQINLNNDTKNTLSVINTMVNKSTRETKKNDKQSTSSSRSQQSVIDSIEENTKNNRTELGISKTNSLRDKRQTHATGKVKNNKQWKKDFIEETSSSETNTSNEITSILSTPNRTRRSMSSSFAMQSPLRIKHKILFTGISSNDYSKLLTKLGASQVDNPTKCTVLVTDKVRRTVKFLCALALSVPIVSVDWLITSEKTGHFIELENYILKDSAAETKFRFKLEESLEKAKEHKLLEGYTLVVTPNVTPPPPELKNIIISCGGKVLLRPPSSWPRNSIIISHEEDLINAKKFLEKAPKTVTVHSTEFVLTGILRQELEFTEFKLI